MNQLLPDVSKINKEKTDIIECDSYTLKVKDLSYDDILISLVMGDLSKRLNKYVTKTLKAHNFFVSDWVQELKRKKVWTKYFDVFTNKYT